MIGRPARREATAPGRWEVPGVDAAALELARHVEAALPQLSSPSAARWERWLAPLAEPLRDGEPAAVAAAGRRVRAAFGVGESVAQALPPAEALALRDAADALLRAIARHEAKRGER
ncbi:MAG: hypothetical protein A2X23_02815 [Chloroflexi bacterium GWC2_73_18]|nr:MAG: hypothetical protein A2X23_02815 [Chloroflexi bacterium GWC2_73_18]